MLPQMIKVGDVLYLVKRVVRFKPEMNIQDWKDWIGVTHSFKKDDHIYFVEEVEVLEFENIKTI
jgi:hypothetical protein